jgi:hypothetical protein
MVTGNDHSDISRLQQKSMMGWGRLLDTWENKNLALNLTLKWKITMEFIVSTNLGENVYGIAKLGSTMSEI